MLKAPFTSGETLLISVSWPQVLLDRVVVCGEIFTFVSVGLVVLSPECGRRHRKTCIFYLKHGGGEPGRVAYVFTT